jgi:putative endonuclease
MSDHDPTISAVRGAANRETGFAPQPEAARRDTGFAPQPEAARRDTGFAPQPEAAKGDTGFAPQPEAAKGDTGFARGMAAEESACAALRAEGFSILGRRMRTPCGEIDLVAATATLLVFGEVKRRRDLTTAAWSLGARQRSRLLAAAEILLALHPDWVRDAIRFDVVLVDSFGRVRRVADAFRFEG